MLPFRSQFNILATLLKFSVTTWPGEWILGITMLANVSYWLWSSRSTLSLIAASLFRSMNFWALGSTTTIFRITWPVKVHKVLLEAFSGCILITNPSSSLILAVLEKLGFHFIYIQKPSQCLGSLSVQYLNVYNLLNWTINSNLETRWF